MNKQAKNYTIYLAKNTQFRSANSPYKNNYFCAWMVLMNLDSKTVC